MLLMATVPEESELSMVDVEAPALVFTIGDWWNSCLRSVADFFTDVGDAPGNSL